MLELPGRVLRLQYLSHSVPELPGRVLRQQYSSHSVPELPDRLLCQCVPGLPVPFLASRPLLWSKIFSVWKLQPGPVLQCILFILHPVFCWVLQQQHCILWLSKVSGKILRKLRQTQPRVQHASVVWLGLTRMQHRPQYALVARQALMLTQPKPLYAWCFRKAPTPTRLPESQSSHCLNCQAGLYYNASSAIMCRQCSAGSEWFIPEPAGSDGVLAVRGQHLRFLNWSNTLSAVRWVRGQHSRAHLLPGRQLNALRAWRATTCSTVACSAPPIPRQPRGARGLCCASAWQGTRAATPRPSHSRSSSTSGSRLRLRSSPSPSLLGSRSPTSK